MVLLIRRWVQLHRRNSSNSCKYQRVAYLSCVVLLSYQLLVMVDIEVLLHKFKLSIMNIHTAYDFVANHDLGVHCDVLLIYELHLVLLEETYISAMFEHHGSVYDDPTNQRY